MTSLKKARAQFRRVLLLLGGFSFVVNLLLLTMPLYMLQIYDRILPSQSTDTLTFLSIIAAAALIVLGLLEAIRAVLAARAATKLETELGADALRLSMEVSRATDGDIQPLRELSSVKQFIASRSVFALLDFPFAPLFIGVLYFIHPILFYLTLAGAVVLILLAVINQWITSAASREASVRQNAAMVSAQAMTRNAETLRAMGMSGNGITVWGEHNADNLIAQASVDERNAFMTGLSRTIRMGLQIAILGVGAMLVLRNEMTAGMIFASSIISGRGLQPIDQVIGGWRQFVLTWRSWKNFCVKLERLPPEAQRTSMPDPKGDMSVEAALVMAPGGAGDPPILNRVSFRVGAGEVIGIVGPSGSGKSTLARVMVGAQKMSAGTVRVDGTDIQNWEPTQLGRHIGYLGQDVDLLPGTIKQNIARLNPQPDDQAVLAAAAKAQVHELIQSLPSGYDTWMGPGGVQLSGGQRQRIALARAFYGNPQMMVLDEPNANLDDDGEVALHKALLAAREAGVTVVIITQRKQVLAIVDKILRLHQGTVDFFDTREKFVEALQKLRDAKAAKAGQQAPAKPAPAAAQATPVAPAASPKPTNGTGKPGNPYTLGKTGWAKKTAANNTSPPDGSKKASEVN